MPAFFLETDPSYAGLGAVLFQKEHDGKIYPIAFASHP